MIEQPEATPTAELGRLRAEILDEFIAGGPPIALSGRVLARIDAALIAALSWEAGLDVPRETLARALSEARLAQSSYSDVADWLREAAAFETAARHHHIRLSTEPSAES